MKLQIIISFLFLMYAGMALSQNYPVTIYGTLVDGKGKGVPNQTIYVSSTKNSKFFVLDKVPTDSSGQFKWSINLPDSIEAGALLLSYLNCDGKEIITEVHFSNQKPIIQVQLVFCDKVMPLVCSSAIVVRRINDSVSVAIVINKGMAPFRHKWSTGQDGDSIRFKTKTDAKICVATSDGAGCISEACINDDPAPHCKSIVVLKKLNDSTGIAIVTSSGKAPFKYKWTNGSDHDTIRFSLRENARFCVVVTDAAGCESTACGATSDYCTSAVLVRRVNDTVAIARVIAQGKGPFKHTWTTGATSDTIVFNPLNKIKICVTSVDTSGCSTEACVSFIPELCGGVIERVGNVLYGYLRGDVVKSWSWSNGSDDPKIAIRQPGEYCVVMHGNGGCEAKVCYTVKELDTTQCTAEIVATALPGPTSNAIQSYKLSINAKFPLKYIHWSTDDTTPSITVKKSGEYCVSISDNVQCKLYICKKVQLADSVKCSLKIQVDTLPVASPGAGLKIRLTALPLFDAKILVWSTNETTKSIVVEKSGTYCVTVSDGIACKLQECVTINLGTVTPPPPPPGDCISNIVVRPISASEAKLVPRVTGLVPFTFLWSTGSKDATINVRTSGTYCVSIKDGRGCITKSCVELSFEDTGSGIMPPLDDQKNRGLAPTTNTSNIELKVYPNPSHDNVNYQVKTRQDQDGTLSVSNMYGKLVYQEKIKFRSGISNGDLDLSFLGSGVYQVTIDQNGYMTTGKIIIAK